VARNEIRVQMSQNYVLDLQLILSCELQISLDVSLGIHNGSCARLFVTDKVGSVGEAIEIELLEDHASLYWMATAIRKAAALTAGVILLA
jgi:hypothetical protein